MLSLGSMTGGQNLAHLMTYGHVRRCPSAFHLSTIYPTQKQSWVLLLDAIRSSTNKPLGGPSRALEEGGYREFQKEMGPSPGPSFFSFPTVLITTTPSIQEQQVIPETELEHHLERIDSAVKEVDVHHTHHHHIHKQWR